MGKSFTALVALALISSAAASTLREPLLNRTGDLGTFRQYCHIHALNLSIALGGYVKSYDTCFEYNCTKHGLAGFGFGSRAEVPPLGCLVREKLCQNYIVQDPASHIKCPMIVLATTKPTPDVDVLCGEDSVLSKDAWDFYCNSGSAQTGLMFAISAAVCFLILVMN